MIHSVRLENFGPHELFEADFKPGVTLVMGANGAGKSHIVQGVGWVIIGPKALSRKQSDYIRDGSKQMSARVEIDILGRRHVFTRQYGSSASATIVVEGEEVTNTIGGVQEYLDSLGFDVDALFVLIAMQDRLTEIVTSTPAARKDLFDRLVRTGQIRDAQNLARAESNISVPKPEGSRKQYTDDIDYHAAKLAQHEQGFQRSEEELGKLEVERTKLESRLSGLAQQKSFDKLDRYHELKQQIGTLRAQEESLGAQLADLPVHSLDELEQTLTKHDEQVGKLQSSVERYEATLDEIQQKLVEWRAKDRAIAAYADQELECPECGHTFCVDHERPDPAQEAELTRLSRACAERLQLARTRYSQAVVAKQDTIHQFDLCEKRGQIQAELDLVVKTKNAIMPEWEKLSAEFIQHQTAAPSGQASHLSKELANLSDSIRDQRAALDTVRNLRVQHGLKLQSLKDKLEQYDEAVRVYEKAVKKSRVWKETTKYLGSFREKVLQDALMWVSARASQILQSIGTIPDVTSQSRLELDSSLDFFLMTGDTKVPISRFSGGQKAAFSICLRIALSDYFSDRLGLQGLLILDAVFESMDTANREATAAALSSAGPTQALIFAYEDLPGLEGQRVMV